MPWFAHAGRASHWFDAGQGRLAFHKITYSPVPRELPVKRRDGALRVGGDRHNEDAGR